MVGNDCSQTSCIVHCSFCSLFNERQFFSVIYFITGSFLKNNGKILSLLVTVNPISCIVPYCDPSVSWHLCWFVIYWAPLLLFPSVHNKSKYCFTWASSEYNFFQQGSKFLLSCAISTGEQQQRQKKFSDLPAHLLLFCLHKVITHKHTEPKSIQLQLTQTFITMMDGPPPWRPHLSTLLIRFPTISKVIAFS